MYDLSNYYDHKFSTLAQLCCAVVLCYLFDILVVLLTVWLFLSYLSH